MAQKKWKTVSISQEDYEILASLADDNGRFKSGQLHVMLQQAAKDLKAGRPAARGRAGGTQGRRRRTVS